MTAYEQQLAHLVAQASTPGWKQYAWHRALELQACSTGMWAGMADKLKAAMNKLKVTA